MPLSSEPSKTQAVPKRLPTIVFVYYTQPLYVLQSLKHQLRGLKELGYSNLRMDLGGPKEELGGSEELKLVEPLLTKMCTEYRMANPLKMANLLLNDQKLFDSQCAIEKIPPELQEVTKYYLSQYQKLCERRSLIEHAKKMDVSVRGYEMTRKTVRSFRLDRQGMTNPSFSAQRKNEAVKNILSEHNKGMSLIVYASSVTALALKDEFDKLGKSDELIIFITQSQEDRADLRNESKKSRKSVVTLLSIINVFAIIMYHFFTSGTFTTAFSMTFLLSVVSTSLFPNLYLSLLRSKNSLLFLKEIADLILAIELADEFPRYKQILFSPYTDSSDFEIHARLLLQKITELRNSPTISVAQASITLKPEETLPFDVPATRTATPSTEKNARAPSKATKVHAVSQRPPKSKGAAPRAGAAYEKALAFVPEARDCFGNGGPKKTKPALPAHEKASSDIPAPIQSSAPTAPEASAQVPPTQSTTPPPTLAPLADTVPPKTQPSPLPTAAQVKSIPKPPINKPPVAKARPPANRIKPHRVEPAQQRQSKQPPNAQLDAAPPAPKTFVWGKPPQGQAATAHVPTSRSGDAVPVATQKPDDVSARVTQAEMQPAIQDAKPATQAAEAAAALSIAEAPAVHVAGIEPAQTTVPTMAVEQGAHSEPTTGHLADHHKLKHSEDHHRDTHPLQPTAEPFFPIMPASPATPPFYSPAPYYPPPPVAFYPRPVFAGQVLLPAFVGEDGVLYTPDINGNCVPTAGMTPYPYGRPY